MKQHKSYILQIALAIMTIGLPICAVLFGETTPSLIAMTSVVGWSLVAVVAVAPIGFAMHVRDYRKSKDINAKQAFVRTYSAKLAQTYSERFLNTARNIMAVAFYFVLGLGWLSLAYAVAIMSVIAIQIMSEKLAKKVLTEDPIAKRKFDQWAANQLYA